MKTDLMLRASAAGLLAVRAEAPPNDDAVLAVIETLRASADARFAMIEEEMNRGALLAAAGQLTGGGGGGGPIDSEYTANFARYARTGEATVEAAVRAANATGERAAIQAAMSESNNSEGGYLVPTEWDRNIRQALAVVSPIRRLADVRFTSVGAYSTLWKLTGVGSGWVGETAARPATASPTFVQIVLGHGEIYANAYATQRILNDAEIDLAAWLTWGWSLST